MPRTELSESQGGQRPTERASTCHLQRKSYGFVDADAPQGAHLETGSVTLSQIGSETGRMTLRQVGRETGSVTPSQVGRETGRVTRSVYP